MGAAVLVGVILFALAILRYWEEVAQLEKYGYLGAFVISLLSSATVIVPVPGIAVVFALGGVVKYPWLLGLLVGMAEPLGELVGYLAGTGGRMMVQSNPSPMYRRMEGWMKRRGGWVLFFFAAFPNPFFDIAGAIAGVLRYPLWKFLLVCWAGKTVKGLTIALGGAWGMKFFLSWFEMF